MAAPNSLRPWWITRAWIDLADRVLESIYKFRTLSMPEIAWCAYPSLNA
jgi:hypothetical protein